MASTDARVFPYKNAAYRHHFWLRDASGALVTGAAASSPDSEVCLDIAGFNDCTNEVAEVGATGYYWIDLTAAEMNADTVAFKFTTGVAGAVVETQKWQPQETDDIRVAVTHWQATVVATPAVAGRPSVDAIAISGDTVAADNLEAALDGTGGVNITATHVGNRTGNVSGSVGSVTGAVGSVTGAVGSVTGAVGSVTGAVGSVAGNVAGNVVGTVASVVGNVAGNVVGSVGSVTGVTQAGIADAVWDEATADHVGAGSFGLAAGSVSASAIADAVHDEVIEGAITFRQSQRVILASTSGKRGGMDTATAVVYGVDDTTVRVSWPVLDAFGNTGNPTRTYA